MLLQEKYFQILRHFHQDGGRTILQSNDRHKLVEDGTDQKTLFASKNHEPTCGCGADVGGSEGYVVTL
jgi:hypothetical protein